MSLNNAELIKEYFSNFTIDETSGVDSGLIIKTKNGIILKIYNCNDSSILNTYIVKVYDGKIKLYERLNNIHELSILSNDLNNPKLFKT